MEGSSWGEGDCPQQYGNEKKLQARSPTQHDWTRRSLHDVTLSDQPNCIRFSSSAHNGTSSLPPRTEPLRESRQAQVRTRNLRGGGIRDGPPRGKDETEDMPHQAPSTTPSLGGADYMTSTSRAVIIDAILAIKANGVSSLRRAVRSFS
ncbi:hypothetical protein PG993_012016 [Apiospora rasikravindrae]|uniref:Uncharacterized protein n=1 Tax=Apiospora rasikravindrae TaxID=990691 RepID=A0ABR1S1C6_9PEZI